MSLNVNSEIYEFFFITGDYHAYSISYKKQAADTQRIKCYSFLSLTIGSCDDAFLNISSTLDKYDRLNDDEIMVIDGKNEEFRFNSIYALDTTYIDELVVYIGQSRNKFNWLSPIEELTTGFISTLSFSNSTIGELVGSELERMPQRDSFLLSKIGAQIYNETAINKSISYFYDLDFIYLKSKDYMVYKNIKNNNMKLTTGLIFNITNSLKFSVSGTFYKHNLFGFEDVSFNQRSEHHFDRKFGSLDVNLRYSF